MGCKIRFGATSCVRIGHILAEHVRDVIKRLGLPTRLSEVGVPEEGIPLLEDVSSDYIPSLNINLTGFERGSLDE